MISIPRFLLIILFISSNIFSQVVARIIKINGRVNLKLNGNEYFDENVRVGLPISNGDGIKVGSNGFCAIMFVDDKSIIKIRENSKFYFIDTQNTRTIDLKYGTLLNDVKTKRRNKSFRIQTPVSVASVKGTQFAVISSLSGIDQFIGKEGLFDVLNMVSGETVSVKAGQKAISNTSGSLIQAPASDNDYPDDPEIEEFLESESQIFEDKKNIDIKPIQDKIINSNVEESNINEKDVETSEIENEPENVIDETEKETNEPGEQGSMKKPFSMGLGVGSVTLDGVLYNQIALRPVINIWKIGVGLDLVFYIDNEGNFREDVWNIKDDLTLLLDKILFITYGKKSDKYWIKYGSIENLTLGYGGLVDNYSNMIEFPTVRKVGVNTGFNIKSLGGEVFLSNVKDFSNERGGALIGSRLSYTISERIPLSFGLNYVADINMFSGLKDRDKDSYPDIFDDFPDSLTLWNDTDGDGIPDPHYNLDSSRWDIDADGDNIYDFGENGDTLINLKATPFSIRKNEASASGLTFDIGYPVLQSDFISLLLYAEYNTLNFPYFITEDSSFVRKKRSGSGISIPGIRSTIMGVFNFSLEYRIINEAYVPQFFNQAYDLNRVSTITIDETTIIKTKDMLVFEGYNDSISSVGLFGSAGFSLFNLVEFSTSYANMKADTTELKSFSTFLNLNTDNIPKLNSAMAYYQRNNDDNPFDFENPSKNILMGYQIGYEISRGVSLIWNYRQFYRDDGTGDLEPIKQTTIETSFNF
jgi:hypothetical protein